MKQSESQSVLRSVNVVALTYFANNLHKLIAKFTINAKITTPSLSKQPDTFCHRAYSSHKYTMIVHLKFPELSTYEKSAFAEKLIYT
jgi:hypothetical protein